MIEVVSPPTPAPAVILGIDASSTSIGWVVYDGRVVDHGEITLKHTDINHRCRLARAAVYGLLLLHPALDCVAIEGPASPHKNSLIPQCLVSGAIRSVIAEKDIVICDVPPQHAKQALCGRGNAPKEEMQAVARLYRVAGEHAADALGVAKAAAERVTVERQAA